MKFVVRFVRRREQLGRRGAEDSRAERGRKPKSGEQEFAFRQRVLEEKRLREIAQQQMLQTQELLKRSEAKANALRAKLRKAEQSKAQPASAESTDPSGKHVVGIQEGSGSLPRIAGNNLPRSSQGAPQQAPLVALEKPEPVEQYRRSVSAAGMADAILRAADLADEKQYGDSEFKGDDDGEIDQSSLLGLKQVIGDSKDIWNDDMDKKIIPKYFTEKEVMKVSKKYLR